MDQGDRLMMNEKLFGEIPVFYACDENFVKYLAVSLQSLISNSSRKRRYHVHILNEGISQAKMLRILQMETKNIRISFDDVSEKFSQLEKKFCLRDYYSKTTYYRLFMPDMFKHYDKAVYIDCDTILKADIAELFDHELADNYIGAVRDRVVAQSEVFSTYVEKALGIRREAYFNAGVVVINCEAFRKNKLFNRFIDLVDTYKFGVAQDQDYLNVICKNKVLWISSKWNAQAVGKIDCRHEEICLIHYNLADKPWHSKESMLADYFWDNAIKTDFYSELLSDLEKYKDKKPEENKGANDHLLQLAISEINNKDNFFNLYGDVPARSLKRKAILNKIAEYERLGLFDRDVEEDPPTIPLKPEDIDYFRRSINANLRARYAFRLARWFVSLMKSQKQFVIKSIEGIENLKNLESGAVITCNHFSPFDCFAVQIAYDKSGHKDRKLYRIIREGNYTSFPGFYGFLMRNCNTLPLSENPQTMKKFLNAVNTYLKHGNFIMIYPEQSMWWNYRKPKPLKKGGFSMAAQNHVPVLPMFITMEDTDVLDAEGFPVQAYTIHVLPPIYPDRNLNKQENARMMMETNYEMWKEVYEKTYGCELTYTTETEINM